MSVLLMTRSSLLSLMDAKYPRLWNGFRAYETPKQRKNWRLIAKGFGIHWEGVDEDIAVTTLLRA